MLIGFDLTDPLNPYTLSSMLVHADTEPRDG